MYAEDLDLFWHVRALGWGAWFEADAEFVHLGNTTSGTQWSLAQRAEVIGSAERAMLEDYLPRRSWRFVIATTRFGYLLRAIAYKVLGNERAAAISAGSARGLGGRANPKLVPTAVQPEVEVLPPRR
jgi:GT2 family glycosyltransferase